MNKPLFILLLFLGITTFAQDNDLSKIKDEDYGLYISGGAHIGLWNLILGSFTNNGSSSNGTFNWDRVPYNIHMDKLFNKKYVLGIGYTYDKYSTNPFNLYAGVVEAIRQNVSIRFYRYLRDPKKTFSYYLGCSAGASYWHRTNDRYPNFSQEWWPTAQFIFGTKINFGKTFFWQTEFCVGPPYACQTSFGIKF